MKYFEFGQENEKLMVLLHGGDAQHHLEKMHQSLVKLQLNHFYNSLELQGMEKCDKSTNWLDAFLLLEKFLQSKDDGSRQVVFLDELPQVKRHAEMVEKFKVLWQHRWDI